METPSKTNSDPEISQLTCWGCRGVVNPKRCLVCFNCAKPYDLECANVPECRFFNTMSPERRKNWKCLECVSKRPKSGNLDTPVGSAASSNPTRRLDVDKDVYSEPAIPSPDAGNSYVNMKRGGSSVIDVFDDTVCMDNMRAAIRDELARFTTERLAGIVSKVVTESFAGPVRKELEALTQKLESLELKVDVLTDEVRGLRSAIGDSGKSQLICPVEVISKPKVKGKHNPNSLKKKSPKKIIHPSVILSSDRPLSLPEDSFSTSHPAPGADAILETTHQLPFPYAQAVSAAGSKTDVESEWTEVRRRRPKSIARVTNVVRGTAVATPGQSHLEAAERRRYLHLYFVKIGTTAEKVQAHLRSICNGADCTIETLKPRGDYASFKLGVPICHVDNALSPANWAADICIKPWQQRFRRQSRDQ